MKKIRLFLMFISAILVFALSGCDMINNEEPEEPIDVPEKIEPLDPNWPVTAFETELSKAPEKVAVASPSLAEYLYDMGLMEKICALSDNCGFGGASAYPSIGSVRIPNIDAIKEADPEYIISFSAYEENVLIELQQMNIKVITIEMPENLDELRALYKELAIFFKGKVDGVSFGENYVNEYNSALEALSYKGEQKTVAFIRALDYIMVTGDSLMQEIISAAGIKNVAETYSDYTYPADNWKEFDPEVLFVNSDIYIIDLEMSDLYKKKSAVKGDMIYNADIDTISIGSKRSFEMLKNILATLYEDYTYGTALEPAYPSMYKTS